MRASTAIALLLVPTMSIFGLRSCVGNSAYAQGPEPVWVNGVMGVYDPDTGAFVPSTSPLFDLTCERIMQRRRQNNFWSWGNGYTHHWYYSPSSHFYTYSGGGASGFRSSSGGTSSGFFSSHFGSSRGGFGASGHSHSGGS